METVTINTNKLDEKIGLTAKLEMKECNKHLRSVKELLEMKFKIVTWREVEQKVWKQGLRAAWKRILIQALVIPALLVGMVFSVTTIVNLSMGDLILTKEGNLFFAGAFLIAYLISLISTFQDLRVEWKWLDKWNYNIPYGALLAVDEAIKQNIKEFKIFYPMMESKLSDPILIGHTENGNIVEIFNWDDGELYE